MIPAAILNFPARGPFAVRVMPSDDNAWLVVARSHGWLHSSLASALADARIIARGFGVAVQQVRQ
jgi:hypothetical protein